MVGAGRADELYRASRATRCSCRSWPSSRRAARGDRLPASLADACRARCDELGSAATLRRTAAVIGRLDIDLLAAVLGRPAVELLDHVEQAAPAVLDQDEGPFRFRHELVMQALAASATRAGRPCRTARLGRVLARRRTPTAHGRPARAARR